MNTPSRSLLRWRCRWSALGLVCCGALIGFITPECSGADYYLKIEGVPGEIATGGFSGWTKLNGVSAEVDHPVPLNPTEPAKTTIEIHFTKLPGATSSFLMSRCASGLIAPKIVLVYVDDAKPSLRITLKGVKITSFKSSTQGGPPEDDIGCIFRSIEWSYAEHNGVTGGTTTTFDIPTQLGSIKPRLPFRALLEQNPRTPADLLLTCPVEAGHRYRVVGNLSLLGPWQTVHEFTADIDGVMDVRIPKTAPLLFLRVEETE